MSRFDYRPDGPEPGWPLIVVLALIGVIFLVGFIALRGLG